MGVWFIDAVLVCIYVVICVALAAVCVSVLLSFKRRSHREGMENGIRVSRVAWGTAAAVAACLALTFALGSPEPGVPGGGMPGEALWLRAADMFIYTVAAQLVAIAVLVVFLPLALKRMRE